MSGRKRKSNEELFENLNKQVKIIQETMKVLKKKNQNVGESESDDAERQRASDSGSSSEDENSEAEQSDKENLPKASNDDSVELINQENSVEPDIQKEVPESVEEIKETPLQEEFAEIFGDDPSASNALQIKIHSSILNRWKFWSVNGIKKEDKENLLGKYQSPGGLEVPKLNPEILLKLPKHSKSRDTHMSTRQQLAGAALAALGSVMTTLIEEMESIDKIQVMEKLHDAGKLMAEIMYSQTKSRKAFIVAGVDKDTKIMLEDTKTEEFLFGKNLSEKFKEAKVMDKVANSMKKQSYKTQGSALTAKQPLNSNSLLGKRPFPNQSGSHQGFQYPSGQAKRLPFRTKQPFNNKAQYQGYNKMRNQTRSK